MNELGGGRMSNIAAAIYLHRYPDAVALRLRTGRVHLVDGGRPECGSLLPQTNWQLVVFDGNGDVRWCYSCIGNAIERMEQKE